MGKKLFINYRYNSFKQTVLVDGDKSISIRALLLGSQAHGKTLIENILLSEDIINSINCLKKLGIKVNLNKKKCYVFGNGINGFNYKKYCLRCWKLWNICKISLGTFNKISLLH